MNVIALQLIKYRQTELVSVSHNFLDKLFCFNTKINSE